MLEHDPAAKTHNRLGFTLSMAVALHVTIILGVGFALQTPSAPPATRLDITLSNHKTEKNIVDADYVAQTNQEASGSVSAKKELTTNEIADINSATINKVQPIFEAPKQQKNERYLQRVNTLSSRIKIQEQEKDNIKKTKASIEGEQERLRRHIEMASLQAKLDEEQQVYARLPRVRRSTSVATKAAEDALYLYNWQQRIETIGNQHYPQAAREQGAFGDVVLIVDIKSDGSLDKVSISQSSGNEDLDRAALKIVRLAAPFAPFSAEMKESTDILQIIRIWQFRKNRFSDRAAGST